MDSVGPLVSMPPDSRHGSFVAISRDELMALLLAYPTVASGAEGWLCTVELAFPRGLGFAQRVFFYIDDESLLRL